MLSASISITDIANAISKAVGVTTTTVGIMAKVAEDPALPLVIKRLETIEQLREKAKAQARPAPKPGAQKPPPGPPGPPPAPKKGIGLSAAVKPMDYYIAYLRRPWLPAVVIGGSVTVLFGLGYLVGRHAGRRTAQRSAHGG